MTSTITISPATAPSVAPAELPIAVAPVCPCCESHSVITKGANAACGICGLSDGVLAFRGGKLGAPSFNPPKDARQTTVAPRAWTISGQID